MGDELFEARNALLFGNFHQTIAEGGSVKCSSKKAEDIAAFNVERDSLLYKAQVGLGQYDAVINELRGAQHTTLVGVRLLAQFHRDAFRPEDAARVAAELNELISGTPSAALAPVAVIASSVSIHMKEYTAALKTAQQWVGVLDAQNPIQARIALELRALAADVYLRINRFDLAEKEVAAMKNVDDEATLTLLTSGLVALRSGAVKPEKYRDAQTAFQELIGRFGTSVTALNLIALAHLGQGRTQDAERSLLDALSKRSGDADTLANLVVVSHQLAKPQEATQRYISQAKAAPPTPWIRAFTGIEERFAEAAHSFAAAN